MRLWRLCRAAHVALDGKGAALHGGRYTPQGVPVVSLASEAGLAVLVTQRYLPERREEWPQDFVLGWTDVAAKPLHLPEGLDEAAIRSYVADRLAEGRSLHLAIRSQVLPEADVILLNPLHPEMAGVLPLVTRHFDFAQCLHRPPMLDRYSGG